MHCLQCGGSFSALGAMGTAKVIVKGGSVKSTGEAISAMGSAQVDVQGAKITGKTSTLGPGAKITGAK